MYPQSPALIIEVLTLRFVGFRVVRFVFVVSGSPSSLLAQRGKYAGVDGFH